MGRSSGFSLVELLVAMTISLMILFMGSYAHGQFVKFWNKELGDFEETMERAKKVDFIFQLLRHTRPHMIKNAEGEWYHYFEGGNTVIRSITSQSMSDPEFAAVYELKIDSQQGYSNLIYREQVIKDTPLYAATQINEFDQELVLDIDFDELVFEFYGWQHVDQWYESLEQKPSLKKQWFGFYSGQDTKVPPQATKITISLAGKTSQLVVPMAHFIPEHVEYYVNRDD